MSSVQSALDLLFYTRQTWKASISISLFLFDFIQHPPFIPVHKLPIFKKPPAGFFPDNFPGIFIYVKTSHLSMNQIPDNILILSLFILRAYRWVLRASLFSARPLPTYMHPLQFYIKILLQNWFTHIRHAVSNIHSSPAFLNLKIGFTPPVSEPLGNPSFFRFRKMPPWPVGMAPCPAGFPKATLFAPAPPLAMKTPSPNCAADTISEVPLPELPLE